MPNGHPPSYDERDWANWRGATTERLNETLAKTDRILRWTERHEGEEFAFHGRIESHLAASVEQRADVVRRLDIVEQQHVDFKKELDQVRFRIWIAIGGIWVGLPVLSYLAIQLYQHIVGHRS